MRIMLSRKGIRQPIVRKSCFERVDESELKINDERSRPTGALSP
jgi:hypothetical protein